MELNNLENVRLQPILTRLNRLLASCSEEQAEFKQELETIIGELSMQVDALDEIRSVLFELGNKL